MDALASVIKDPLEDPFLFEQIVIQSRGMKQWISIELAKRFGICANINYSFPREVIEQFSLKSQFDSNMLFWKIMGLLPELIHDDKYSPRFRSIKAYLSEDKDGIRLYQLSSNIAALFDDYRIYRPDILSKWQNNIDIFKGSHLNKGKNDFWTWQAILFRQLIENGIDCSPVKLAEDFEKSDLTQRISVFGISSYPPLFLNFFEQLSFFIDINLFLLVPSKEFFGYSTPRFINRAELEQEQYLEAGNPLVASFGKSGRDLQVLIEEFNYHEPLPELWHDPLLDSETMLSFLQSDILNLFERKHGKDKEPVDISIKDDNSISIHSCHTPMREVQVLKDQLLNLFEKNLDLKPDDIIVMMPDIESYAPLIEAVFSTEYRFSYSISDRKQRTESEIIKAFLKIINIMGSRFELHPVLDLLSQAPIAEKFSIDQTELNIIEKYTENAGIRWGIDSDYKKKAGLPKFNENTWQFGLQRLMLGYAMPEDSNTLFCNVLPAHCSEGAEAEIFGKFALFLDTLFRGATSLSRQNNIFGFCKTFKQILNSMIAKAADNESEFLFILDIIQQVENQSDQALFDNKISFAVALKIIENKLSQSVSAGSFMTGGITFCNLMPMRSIPFKVVGLMGMSELDFPRKSGSRSFDLIERFPRIGDKNVRDEDRFLFLEALISARENFIITYTGADIKDNSPIPCSTSVSELVDVIMDSFKLESEDELICYHPLQPFSPKYFTDHDKYFSFSTYALKISENFSKRSDNKEMFINRDFSLSALPEEDISLDSLCYFLKQPLEYMIKNRLGIVLQESSITKDDREPVVIDQLDNFQLGSDILEQGVDARRLSIDYDRYRATGRLSFGKKGKVDLEEIYTQAAPIFEKAEAIIEKEGIAPQNVNISLNGINVSGSIDLVKEGYGRFILTFGKLNPQRLLKGWIYHLALNISLGHGNSFKTVLVGKNTSQSKDIAKEIVFSEIDRHDAYKLLSDLVDCYQSGSAEPFIFFPETSYEFVKRILKTDSDFNTDRDVFKDNILSVMQQCKAKWYNSFFNTGDKINRYTSLYFGEQDLFQNVDYLISTGFVENSIRVFKPLMEHMR
ncbi:MAG: exodeoxyribonuclease V subunit gamma [Desulfobacteraceae bacterium]|nr:exodeoxyribonuclease V subunit gamma [Desulfobacteraceae bacterium]